MSQLSEQFSKAIEQALAGMKGNSISWDLVLGLLQSNFNLDKSEVNISKVSSVGMNYANRLKQRGFSAEIKVGIIVAKGVPLTQQIIASIGKQIPEPKWPLLIFQDDANGKFLVTDFVPGVVENNEIESQLNEIWTGVETHSREKFWGNKMILSSKNTASNSDRASEYISLLAFRKNLVLEGVPGTGKSFAVREIVEGWKGVTGRDLAPPHVIVLHPSSSYEDLVEGLRPNVEVKAGSDFVAYPPLNGEGSFHPQLGRFTQICQRAAQNPEVDYLLVMDELNRANVPKVLGELMLVIDRTKRAKWNGSSWTAPEESAVLLTYSGVKFWVPDNLHILGTMNTTDRSVAALDSALRRRFDFMRVEPMSPEDIKAALGDDIDDFLLTVIELWAGVNQTILRPMIGPDAMLGHSYIFELAELLSKTQDLPSGLKLAFLEYSFIPQIVESIMMSGRETEIFGVADSKRPQAIQDLDSLLSEFGKTIRLVGDGLNQRVVIVNENDLDDYGFQQDLLSND